MLCNIGVLLTKLLRNMTNEQQYGFMKNWSTTSFISNALDSHCQIILFKKFEEVSLVEYL